MLKQVRSRRTLVGIVASFVVLGIILDVFFYLQYIHAQKNVTVSSSADAEVQKLVKNVSRFISLPEGELPTIATVSDYTKLNEQPFFEKSQNGDKVLIYPKAKKAYLYRPSTNRLIDVTLLNVDSGKAEQTIPPSQSPMPSEIPIVLRNGTTTVGLTNTREPEIKKALPNAVIVSKENAGKNDYETTLVIILNESASLAGTTLAEYLNATVASLPADEIKPSYGDILVILGEDSVSSPNPSSSEDGT